MAANHASDPSWMHSRPWNTLEQYINGTQELQTGDELAWNTNKKQP